MKSILIAATIIGIATAAVLYYLQTEMTSSETADLIEDPIIGGQV